MGSGLDMAIDVYVHPDTVDITFNGLDRLLAFQDRLILPMSEITAAYVTSVESTTDDRGWRPFVGYLPGRLATGHFSTRGRHGGTQLWCVYRDEEVLVIETTRRHPTKVVLQHPDRHNLAWLIGERLNPAA